MAAACDREVQRYQEERKFLFTFFYTFIYLASRSVAFARSLYDTVPTESDTERSDSDPEGSSESLDEGPLSDGSETIGSSDTESE